MADISRKARTSQAMYFNRARKYDRVLLTEMRRPKHLEHENAKLRKVVARPLAPQGDAADVVESCEAYPQAETG